MTTAETSEPGPANTADQDAAPAAAPADPVGDPARPLTVSGEALLTVLDVRAGEDDPAGTALRVEITGSTMTDFQYALDLVPVAEAAEDDLVYPQGDHDELTVIVPAASVARMTGATLDVPSQSAAGGLVIRNPNTPDPLDGFDLDLDGELPQKVQAVLDQAINPALASHGGYATLVDIQDTTVYVTMGGGCQGCAASAMTLRDGIRSMLMGALPEITDVVDATDHAAGENPFYT
jgi:Fe/S biogenesis protein NfuA